MNDTVTRLLALADDYALRNYHHEGPDSREAKRKALQDELVRLFTPLSDEEVDGVFKQLTGYNKPTKAGVEFARAVEKAHGIGGES